MTKAELTKLMDNLIRFYPQTRIDDVGKTVDAWMLVMKDYSYDEAEKAMIELVKSDNRDYAPMPHIGKLVHVIENGRHKYKFRSGRNPQEVQASKR